MLCIIVAGPAAHHTTHCPHPITTIAAVCPARYGMFKQLIKEGYQVEVPDIWLTEGNPWEVKRHDIRFEVAFSGKTVTDKGKTTWIPGEKVRGAAGRSGRGLGWRLCGCVQCGVLARGRGVRCMCIAEAEGGALEERGGLVSRQARRLIDESWRWPGSAARLLGAPQGAAPCPPATWRCCWCLTECLPCMTHHWYTAAASFRMLRTSKAERRAQRGALAALLGRTRQHSAVCHVCTLPLLVPALAGTAVLPLSCAGHCCCV